jgi:ribosomal protein L7/L12
MNAQTAVTVASVLLAILAVGLLQKEIIGLQRRMASVARLEAKVDLLLKQAGITYDPYKGVSREITDAVQRGRKIEAIKIYRASTGVGLKEAKDFVEELQRRAGLA